MKRYSLRTCSALVLASLALASGAAAQQQPAQPGRGGGQPPVRARQQAEEGPILSVRFPGGTVDQYVAALRHEVGEDPVNIAVSSKAGALAMPATELSSVSVYTAVSAIESAVEPPAAYFWAIRVLPRSNDSAGAPAFAVGLQSSGQLGGPTSSDPFAGQQLQVFDTREVTAAAPADTAAASIESLLTAIDTAIGMSSDRDEQPPQVKFHKDTGLLIIRGTGRQVEVARSVIRELSQGLRKEQAMNQNARAQEMARNIARKRAEIAVSMADTRLSEARQRLDRSRQLKEQGQISDPDFLAAQSLVSELEAQRELAMLDLSAADASADIPTPSPNPSRDQLADLVRRIKDLETENAGLREKIDQLSSKTRQGGGKTTPR